MKLFHNLLLSAVLFSAFACGDPDLTALNKEMEDAHTVLVTQEHYVIEHYFDHQEFSQWTGHGMYRPIYASLPKLAEELKPCAWR